MHRSVFVWLSCLWCGLLAGSSLAGPPDSDERARPRRPVTVHRTPRLKVYTDLEAAPAKALVVRLERVWQVASRYWGGRPRGTIRCYVVDDLNNWDDHVLPHRLGRIFVGGVGGAVVSEREAGSGGQRLVATVYASSRPGIAEHELVHAYCSQSFAETGPEWYKEGMAELAVLASEPGRGLQCADEQIQQMRADGARTAAAVRQSNRAGISIGQSLDAMLAHPKNRYRQVPLSDWTKRDTHNVAQTRIAYQRYWALCYLLTHNPNYAKRFRLLGKHYLRHQEDVFHDMFGAVDRELEFEFAFFQKHVGAGFRADLAHWDWQTRLHSLDDRASVSARVEAARGYQSAGLKVTAGRRYAYQTTGQWRTSDGQPMSDADGTDDGRGCLVGVVFNDFRLSEPVILGAKGVFTAPASGHLHVRCADDWGELSDNEGQILVRFRRP